jgi:hypothetical protein
MEAVSRLFARLDRAELPVRSTKAVIAAGDRITLLPPQTPPGRPRILLNGLEILLVPTAEFLVEIKLDVRAVITATCHFVPLTDGESIPFNVSESAARSFARALPKRDITVPTGQSKTLAISR